MTPVPPPSAVAVPADASPEEAAAVVAAVEALWPRAQAAPAEARPSAWRFSGRWWADPVVRRRARP